MQARFGFDSPIFNTGIVPLGLGRQLSQTVSFWLGYDFVPKKDVTTKKSLVEQEVWQQLLWKIPTQSPTLLTSRSRLGERRSTAGSGVSFRLRQKFTIKMNGSTRGGSDVPHISNEIFFNLNHPEWVSSKAVQQNRLFFGFDVQIGKDRVLEIGYLNQLEFREGVNRMNHIISFSCVFS